MRPLAFSLAILFPITAAAAVEPKVAIVVVGDADEALRSNAEKLEGELTKAGLRVPADPALRAALKGKPSDGQDDGLDRLRALRRALGLSSREDTETFAKMGGMVGGEALVIVRKQKATVIAEVFDVPAQQFYQDVIDLETSTEEQRVAFVSSRASAALRRAQDPTSESTVATAAGATAKPGETPVDEPKKKPWIKKNWPYILAGALLIGTVTFFAIDARRDDSAPPPVLRFRPGDS